MIETRHLKNVVFLQSVLSFVVFSFSQNWETIWKTFWTSENIEKKTNIKMVRGKYSWALEIRLAKKENLIEINEYWKAFGYVDRDDHMYKTRIHTRTNSYRTYLDNTRNSTGTAPMKKQPPFDRAWQKVISDKAYNFAKTFTQFIRFAEREFNKTWKKQTTKKWFWGQYN